MWMSGKLPPLTKQTGHTCGRPLLKGRAFKSCLKPFLKGKFLLTVKNIVSKERNIVIFKCEVW